MAEEQLAEAILNHALEIICLLTVEDLIVVKRSPNGRRPAFSIHVANRDVRGAAPGNAELLLTPLGMGDKTQKMVAELANNIVRLLTKEVPSKCKDAAAHFPKDEWRYLEEPRERYKANQDSRIVEPPVAPVQKSTVESYPIIRRIKEELGEGPHQSTGGTSSVHTTEIISGSPEGESVLPIVNVYIPLDEDQTESGIGFITSCDIKCEPGEDSSDDTIDSADEESPQYLPSPDLEYVKEEPEESQDSNISVSVSVCVDPISPANSLSKDEEPLPPKTDYENAGAHESRFVQTGSPCEVCGEEFSSKLALEKHLQMHDGERPYPCNECPKRFSKKTHLTTHKRSHSGERPYACDRCDRRFINHQHLVLHQVVHTGEKPYSCPVCGKGFTRQSSVIKHSGMHAEQKPFVCDQCGKSYCQYANLVVHQRLHSGEKPFVCKYCDKGFICKATMLRHQRAHTGEKPYPCPQCDKCFIDHSSLAKHKRKIHAKEPKPA